ncbi:acylneuraminate cytidylyltransferase family protein [Leptospira mtsangambouensis]|uniref:Acylneuraminate cytidylyltransferase family protein n=1 Tax=Leptospira mtsangambouensis TaxID=2484912 RepID=A0ABY2P593_9LEPT|nr:acylneuraminate cytidylyltransferase family protein [Leptospira mtsangambouensis]TGM82287.1 acylneuraminate cytidylyltransferase family protein [Leptospira mtsangambouensis]
MRILSLIPARGGSKRLPGKNIKLLGGKPLIAWSIDVAKEIPEICDILVSTDSQEIAESAKNYGGYVPWLRPENLSTDTSSSADMAIHALQWYEDTHGKVDGLLLLQPTSPFRKINTIQFGIDLFKKTKNAVVGVSKTHTHPSWSFKIENDILVPFLDGSGTRKRSQDLEDAYNVNGSFYLTSPSNLISSLSFFEPKVTPLVIDNEFESVDIDTLLDFQFAEFLLSKNMIH